MILNQPIEEWPVCEALISFFSDGFPLEKAEAYVKLVKPRFVVNDLSAQHLLLDRRLVYNTLLEHGIPVPRHVVVDRDSPPRVRALAPTAIRDADFEETEEYVRVGNTRIDKPFVEKPVDAEDHNVCIYYGHMGMGGGAKQLFRKVGNSASQYVEPPEGELYVHVRRDGSYMYEDFMSTGGTDVKVYTVGPSYAHAEARKSPVVDGRVVRDENGKEVRYPVVLTPEEKEIARRVVIAFDQAVCGFDLLRCKGRSYVCDVNGWSFVKGSAKYYDDASTILRAMILSAVAPLHVSRGLAEAAAAAAADEKDAPMPSRFPSGGSAALPSPSATSAAPAAPGLPLRSATTSVASGLSLASSTAGGGGATPSGVHEELRCVLAVIRHGDRTPKQKMKLKVTDPRLLELICKHNGGRPRKQVKLKRPAQLEELLDVARAMVQDKLQARSSSTGGSGAGSAQAAASAPDEKGSEDLEEEVEKLRQVVAVLEEGGHFSGINRKAQLKPLAWAPVDVPLPQAADEAAPEGGMLGPLSSATAQPSASQPGASAADMSVLGGGDGDGGDGGGGTADGGAGGNERVTQALLVLKFGGVLTPLGRAQAEALGRNFRETMYPPGENVDGSVLPGLLRLHSTYRHDLKVYSSDEGRVQVSAAAFAKGLLDLETPKVRDGGAALAPILASLVVKDARMLDFVSTEVAADIACAKEKLYKFMTEGSLPMSRGSKVLDSSSGGSDTEERLVAGGGRQVAAQVAASAMLHGSSSSSAPVAITRAAEALSDQVAKWPGLGDGNSRTDLETTSGGDQADDVPPAGVCMTSSSPSHSGLFPLPEESGGGDADADWDDPPSPSGPDGDVIGQGLMGDAASEDLFQFEQAVRSRPPGTSVESAVLCRPAGVPPNPLRLLHRMLYLIKALTRQLSAYCRNAVVLADAADGWAERLGPLAPRASSPGASTQSTPPHIPMRPLQPAGGETFLLLHARWKKLERDIYHEKKRRFDISKVPDVLDSAKYDHIHNAHLRLEALTELLPLAERLADGVVPNEYGTHPHSKLRIGGAIARDLLKKLLTDLANTRDETFVAVKQGGGTEDGGGISGGSGGGTAPEPEACNISGWQRQVMADRAIKIKGAESHAGLGNTSVRSPKSTASQRSATSAAAAGGGGDAPGEPPVSAPDAAGEEGGDGDGGSTCSDDEGESTRLHPAWGASEVNSPHRHVRTRIYFTSESHIHSLLSVLRFCHLEVPPDSVTTTATAAASPCEGAQHAEGSAPAGVPAVTGGGIPSAPCQGDKYRFDWFNNNGSSTAAAAPSAGGAGGDGGATGTPGQHGRKDDGSSRRQAPLLSPAAEAQLRECPDYLAHIVFRMFERLEVAPTDPKRFRLELSYSRGASIDWSVVGSSAGAGGSPSADGTTLPLPEAAYAQALMHRVVLQNDAPAGLSGGEQWMTDAEEAESCYMTLEQARACRPVCLLPQRTNSRSHQQAELLLWRFKKITPQATGISNAASEGNTGVRHPSTGVPASLLAAPQAAGGATHEEGGQQRNAGVRVSLLGRLGTDT